MSEAGRAPTERNTTTIGGSRSLEALRGTRTLNERSKGLGHYSWAPVAPCTYNGSAATTGAQGRERAGSDRVSGAGAKDGSDRGMVKDKGEGGGQQRRKCVLATRWAWGRTVRRRICVSRSIRRSVSLSLSLSPHMFVQVAKVTLGGLFHRCHVRKAAVPPCGIHAQAWGWVGGRFQRQRGPPGRGRGVRTRT